MRSVFSIAACGIVLSIESSSFAADAVSGIIDSEIDSALHAKNLKAAPRATDEELLRRIYLDILGRIPTVDEATKYLSDEGPNRHHRLIDELLKHDEMPAYWRTVFDESFNSSLLERDFGKDGFLDYLEHAIRTNKPWDQIAREMLAPDLADEQQRGAAYFLAVRLRGGDNAEKTDRLTSGVATVFFGVQLQCAKCHDHPFVDQWKQDNYYGLAAFLGRIQEARIGNTPVIKERADGEIKFVTTGQEEKTAKLMFLDGRVFAEPQPPEDRKKWYTKGEKGLPDVPFFSRRALLVDYALTAESPLFTRAIVNRLWKQLMGRGLVEPVDQMHEANPASHPELLNRLSDDFAGVGKTAGASYVPFDLRRLMSGILHSEAYLRSSRWTGNGERPRDRDYAAAITKPLTPNQLATSIGIATGHYDALRAKLEREKAKRKIETVTPSIARAFYTRERGVREFASRFLTAGDEFEANVSQALFLSYNPLMQKQLEPSRGNLVERLGKQKDDVTAVQQAFLTILSREPSADELDRTMNFLAANEPQREKLWQDLVWALLCSSEFRFNH